MLSMQYFYLNSRDELLRIDINNLVFIEAEGNYSRIHIANNQTGLVCIGLSKMEELIAKSVSKESAVFARIGKRYIVNLRYIFRISVLKQELVLSDQHSFSYNVSVSKEALKNLKDAITKKSI